MSVDVGAWVWIPDEDDYVLPAQVVSLNSQTGKFKLQNGTERELTGAALSNLEALDPQCLDETVSNLIGLSNLSENALLHNLRIRFKADAIYTFVSSILIAVNPFRQLPIYGVETLEKYRSTVDKSTLPPHIFTIADNAFRAMMTDGTSQSVVISGESGAGKTESTKLLLEFLAELSGRANADGDSIQQQILQCNPVMEAFGNAKTVRNNNSSRFGKLITIRFGHGSIKGAGIISYLLEKSRVVHQQSEERNYHFFYQLVAAAAVDKKLSASLQFTSDDEFYYITQSNVNSIEGVSDLEEYNEVRSAMEVLGLSEEDQIDLCKVVAGILHIGNIKFSGADTSGDEAAKIEDMGTVSIVSGLLGMSEAELQRCLTSRNIGTRSIITCTLTPTQALDARDALAKKIYGLLFDWLIASINKSLAGEEVVDDSKTVFIAVLDIFGFEAFEHNSFEQLCINYCNEKLQFHFNNHIFLMEQAEYASEGVAVAEIKYEDNQPTLDLLELKPVGIFSMIDEEISVPRGSDEGLLSKIFQKYSSHPNIQRPKAKVHKNIQECFVVVHYAGEVAYNVVGFLEKNKDALPPDLEELGKQSSIPFVQNLFKKPDGDGADKDKGAAAPGSKGLSRRATPKKMGLKNTLGNQFKQQLTTLMDTLHKTDPHFVRCMKPNMEKVGRKYHSQTMLAQLRYAGLLEVCRIRQLGFPNRMPFEKFLRQYHVLQPSATDATSLASLLTSSNQLAADQYVIGNTKVFLKHAAAAQLDVVRDAAYFSVASRVQRVVRGFVKRRRFRMFMNTLAKLKTAVSSKEKGVIEDAVALAVDLPNEGNHLPVVKSARDLLRRFKEEDKVNQLLTEAIAERQVALLEGAIRTARGMKPPLTGSLFDQAVALVDRVKLEKAHLAAAPDVVKSKSLDQLEQWMAKAEELGVEGSDAARGVQTMMDRLQDEQSILDELENAIASQNLQVLHAFLGKATEMGLDKDPIFVKAKQFQHELEEMHTGVHALEMALETPHFDSLKSAIEKAKACKVPPTEASMKRALYVVSIFEQVESVEQSLKGAVDASDLGLLQVEVRRAEEVMELVKNERVLQQANLEVHALSTAKSLIQSLTKQKESDEAELSQQDELAASIRSALADKEFSYLRSMISQAKGQGMSRGKHADLIKEGDAVLEKMRIAMDIEMALVAAIRMRDVTALDAAIAKADQAQTSQDTTASSISAAKKLRTELMGQKTIIDQLKTAMENKDVLAMDTLLQEAEKLNVSGRAIDDARIMLDREGLVGSVQKLLEEATNVKTLSEAIDKAVQLGLSGEVMDKARARQLQMADGSSVSEEIQSAMRNIDVVKGSENGLSPEDLEPLRAALQGAVDVLVESDPAMMTLKKQADSTLLRAEKQLELQQTLLGISDLSPSIEIKKAVRMGADMGLKNFRGFVTASAVLDRMDETNTSSIIQRALTSDEEFTYEKFDQMKEELYQEARQSTYVFTNFPNLRSPEEFAKGSMLNKRKIMEGFLKHQKGPIGRSLSNLSADDNRSAIIAFKSLLGYCGDKAVTFPASQALDFLNIGLNNPNLRNELFLQAIKQTVSNPSSYAQARAFHVICLCCDTFQPQPDVYYYIINYLLSHVDTITEGQDPTPVQQMAVYALGRIQAMHNSDPDSLSKTAIDVENVEAYSARLPTVAKIFSPDDTLLGELLVAPDVDVEALLMLLCQIMGIHYARRSVLGLYVVTTKSNALAPMTLLPDKDFYIGDVYQAPLLQKYGRPLKFYVKRKLLGPGALTKFCRFSVDDDPESEEQEQALIDLTFCQMTRRVAEESIKISDHNVAAKLAAYQLATEAEFIPGRVDIALGMGCLNYIGEGLREVAAADYWGEKVAEALHECVDVEDEEIKDRYLAVLDSIPASSMQTYMCIKGGNCTPGKVSHIPDAMVIGIDPLGLHFMDGEADNMEVLFTARYADIRKFAMKTNSIRFTLESIDGSGAPYDLEVITPLNEEISQYCLLYRPVKQQQASGARGSARQSNSGQAAAAQSRLDRLKALS